MRRPASGGAGEHRACTSRRRRCTLQRGARSRSRSGAQPRMGCCQPEARSQPGPRPCSTAASPAREGPCRSPRESRSECEATRPMMGGSPGHVTDPCSRSRQSSPSSSESQATSTATRSTSLSVRLRGWPRPRSTRTCRSSVTTGRGCQTESPPARGSGSCGGGTPHCCGGRSWSSSRKPAQGLIGTPSRHGSDASSPGSSTTSTTSRPMRRLAFFGQAAIQTQGAVPESHQRHDSTPGQATRTAATGARAREVSHPRPA